jgi:hypothetical protein
MNFIDLHENTNIMNELLLLSTIDDLISLKLTCKILFDDINISLQTILQNKFYTTDGKPIPCLAT